MNKNNEKILQDVFNQYDKEVQVNYMKILNKAKDTKAYKKSELFDYIKNLVLEEANKNAN